jgi:hypothetical protein
MLKQNIKKVLKSMLLTEKTIYIKYEKFHTLLQKWFLEMPPFLCRWDSNKNRLYKCFLSFSS